MFYAAEILMALACLHENDVAYRDLKPENILMDASGHIPLTDFGLSKEAITEHDAGSNTFCGTPEYLAPELIERQGHGKAVDFWTLGILIYEMLHSKSPFYDKYTNVLYQNIMHKEIKFAPFTTEAAKDLISKLLTRNVDERLGSSSDDALEVMAHPWWRAPDAEDGGEMDWDRLLAYGYTPEFAPPQRNGSIDVGNFDEHHTKKTVREPIVKMSDEQIQAARFDGFTYNGDEDEASALATAMRSSTISSMRASTLSSTLQSVGEEED